MRGDKPSNVAASVRRRLLDIIRASGEDPNLLWRRYAAERLLYRLSVSEHARDFILKGAMLFLVWTRQPSRPTKDLDLLGRGEDSPERLAEIFRHLCGVEVEPDGLVFDPESVAVEPIREGQRYQGQRVSLRAFLGKARIALQVDIGFGDAVTPAARKVSYPTLLDFPTPRIRAYPRETVVAEKFQAMAFLGIANSRMKDFYDLYVLSRDFEFQGDILARAIRATFERRRTDIPAEPPIALTGAFAQDETKAAQWTAFLRKSSLAEGVPGLPDLLPSLRDFLLPPMHTAAGRERSPGIWNPGGPWS